MKKVYQSKTLGLNTVAPLLSFALVSAGLVVPAEVQISILSVANWVLRFFTNKSIIK